MHLRLPYGTSYLETVIPEERLAGILALESYTPEKDGISFVQDALSNPIGSSPLHELASSAQKIVVVTSDHTRPLPSKLTLPYLLKELRQGNPSAEITILVATGLHRAPTPEEMIAKFGADVVERENFSIHKADDYSTLVRLGDLPSGAPFWVNRLAVEADLLIAEGFIEPHFFAGYSGGRKSIMPGISGRDTILVNHSAAFIDHPNTQSGIIDGNIFHNDMEDAARQAGLRFILNVTLDEQKNIIGAFAGHPVEAFAQGVKFVEKLTKLSAKRSEIVLTSNGGYPLDQNLYQAVKSMCTASYAAQKGGVIITASSCLDGIGGEVFHKMLLHPEGAGKILEEIRATSPTATDLDQWQVQVLVRLLLDYKIIVVTEGVSAETLNAMGMSRATTLDEALHMAYALTSPDAKVTVIPNGAGIFIESLD